MEAVKLYLVTAKDYMCNQYIWYSLSLWNKDSFYKEGYDDGGVDYALPYGYTLGTSSNGKPAIFDPQGQRVLLDIWRGQPAILAPITKKHCYTTKILQKIYEA